MIATEQRLEQATTRLHTGRGHDVSQRHRDIALARAAARGMILSPEQRGAFEHVTDARDLGTVIGYAGTGKSAMLGVAREAWEGAGYQVQGLALSGIAAENLESGSGIASRTIATCRRSSSFCSIMCMLPLWPRLPLIVCSRNVRANQYGIVVAFAIAGDGRIDSNRSPTMEHSAQLRAAARATYDACYPEEEWARCGFEKAERYGTVHCRQAVGAAPEARSVLTAEQERRLLLSIAL